MDVNDDIAEMREEYIRLIESENEDLRREIHKLETEYQNSINDILKELDDIRRRKKNKDVSIPYELLVHKKPLFYKNGTYEKVSICHLCYSIGQYCNNPFIYNVCSYCGGEPDVVISKAAKWVVNEVETEQPFMRKRFWLFGQKKEYTKIVKSKEGKWVFSDEDQAGKS